MAWLLTKEETRTELEKLFLDHGIPIDQPGFYDHPRFLEQERRDPNFLRNYARYIEARAYSDDYLQYARRRVNVAAEAVRAAIEQDGRLGACVDGSGMLGRMLDRLGVWNYVAKSTLTILFPPASRLTPRYFWSFDEGNFVAPHAIVVAPPFYVVDLTVRLQPYTPRQVARIPKIVLADKLDKVRWEASDLANPEILQRVRAAGGKFEEYLQRVNPEMAQAIKTLPPRRVWFEGTALKYVVVAAGGFNEDLEALAGYKPAGRTALQIFETDIAPHFKLRT